MIYPLNAPFDRIRANPSLPVGQRGESSIDVYPKCTSTFKKGRKMYGRVAEADRVAHRVEEFPASIRQDYQ